MQTWRPDEQLIPAVRTGRCSRAYADLTGPDQAWVIAGLTLEGHTAERIDELLRCSLRTVRVVQGGAAAAIAVAFMAEAEAFTQELRLARAELAAKTAALEQMEGQNRRLRAIVVRLSAPKDEDGVPLCPKGKHRMTRYNVYSHGGRDYCRGCHRDRQADYRQKNRVPA